MTDWTDTQANSEPMISMTVRERDRMLYRIKELESENVALKARIKLIETAHGGVVPEDRDELVRLRSDVSHVKGLLFLAISALNQMPIDVKMGVDPNLMGQTK